MDEIFKQKRKHPRILVDMFAQIKPVEGKDQSSGILINASESGLLLQAFKDMPTGKRIVIQVSFSQGQASHRLRAIAEIVWKDSYAWHDLEAYQYGLKFVKILEEDYLKLKEILRNQSAVEDVQFSDKSDKKDRLIIKAKLD